MFKFIKNLLTSNSFESNFEVMPSKVAEEIANEYTFMTYPLTFEKFEISSLAHACSRVCRSYETLDFKWLNDQTKKEMTIIDIDEYFEATFPYAKQIQSLTPKNTEFLITMIMVFISNFFYPSILHPYSKKVYMGKNNKEHTEDMKGVLYFIFLEHKRKISKVNANTQDENNLIKDNKIDSSKEMKASEAIKGKYSSSIISSDSYKDISVTSSSKVVISFNCKNCKTEYKDGDKFCSECGLKI